MADSTKGARGVVLIAGASGMIGHELGLALARAGHELRVLTRDPAALALPFPATAFAWGDARQALAGADAVVNLAGESIADGRWTAARKQSIERSRTEATAALTATVAGLPAGDRPRVFVQASAVGYYGDRGDETLDERDHAGSGFLADVCKRWEAAVVPMPGVRLVTLRIGVVLGLGGGALAKLLGLYAQGRGGNLGRGDQWVPFIHERDLTRMLLAALADERWQGVFNATSPEPCRWRDLHKAILAARGGGVDLAVPRAFVRVGLGEQAAMVLEGARALPRAAQRLGFAFELPTIGAAVAAAVDQLCDPAAAFLFSRQYIPRPVAAVWPFFADEKNLETLTPPWLRFHVTGKSTPALEAGTLLDYKLSLHGVPFGWRTRIVEWVPGERFVDTQLKGPYALWHHTHRFEALAGGTLMTDLVAYRLPVGPLGGLVAGAYVARDVGRIFAYRRQTISGLAQTMESSSLA